MFNIIERYINNMSVDDIRNFATAKDINLSDDELTFTYNFVKKNWEQVINNPKLLNLERYKDRFSPENFTKIQKLFNEYSARYKSLLG